MIAVLIAMAAMVVLYLLSPRHPGPDTARTRQDINGLARAIGYFEEEYAKFPNTPSLDFETEGPQAAAFTTVLLGKEDSDHEMQNPRQIAFLNVRVSKNKKQGGLVFSRDKKIEGIYDGWGHPLRVILRPPGQATLTVPHAGKPVTTDKPVVVLSRGADGKWFTKDDLVSNDTKS